MVINADPQDGLDAAERARSGYRGEWHPLLAAVEGPVGTWTMTAPDGSPYGIIRLLTSRLRAANERLASEPHSRIETEPRV